MSLEKCVEYSLLVMTQNFASKPKCTFFSDLRHCVSVKGDTLYLIATVFQPSLAASVRIMIVRIFVSSSNWDAILWRWWGSSLVFSGNLTPLENGEVISVVFIIFTNKFFERNWFVKMIGNNRNLILIEVYLWGFVVINWNRYKYAPLMAKMRLCPLLKCPIRDDMWRKHMK